MKYFAITIAFWGWLCYNNEAVYRDVNSIVYVLFGHKTCNTIDYVFREVYVLRQGIHPDYYQATVTCNCGNTFVTGSTKEDIHVEICSKCHPFYTGHQKATKARGRIDKFNKKYGIEQ